MYRTTQFILQAVVCLLSTTFASVAATATPDTISISNDNGSNILSSRQGQEQEQGQRDTNNRLVFCHFMIGIVGLRTSPHDYDADMLLAKETGIDAFALNIGLDTFTDTQLSYAYASAATHNISLFISFDFNWWDATSETTAKEVGNMIAQFAYEPAQLWVEGKVFASSYSGDALDVEAMRDAAWDGAGVEVFWAPNYRADNLKGEGFAGVDGALNWMAWPNNGNNKAPTTDANFTVEDGDKEYMDALAGKPYIAPISPWFSTHYGPEVPYSKNFVFPSELLWYNRWVSLLELNPRFIEILTWNDYGESHYVGPLSSPHNDDGNSKWTNDMPHTPFLTLSKPFIQAYKNQNQNRTRNNTSTSISYALSSLTKISQYIKTDQLFYWYRPTPKTLNCSSTDTTTTTSSYQPPNNASGNFFPGPPNGADSPMITDSIFVVSLLTSPAIITITSGSGSGSDSSSDTLNQSQSQSSSQTYVFKAKAGSSSFSIPMQIGRQQFSVERNGEVIMSGISRKDVVRECVCGIYNFNVFVEMMSSLGSISETAGNGTETTGKGVGGGEEIEDCLRPEGLAMFMEGLRVSECSAVPSLGMTSTTTATASTTAQTVQMAVTAGSSVAAIETNAGGSIKAPGAN